VVELKLAIPELEAWTNATTEATWTSGKLAE
jgi:hypothetical protein